jgi:SAM-dependent methyltransferase
MRRETLDLLICAACQSTLQIQNVAMEDSSTGNIEEGELKCIGCGKRYPVRRSVPRFVSAENYASSFGFQWQRFDHIQIDKVMGNNLSRDRFVAGTKWPARLEGERILEAGSGAGRFTQLALETGADVYSFDLSDAVDANYRNNGGGANFHLLQASIYDIPLRRDSFDKIFCFGVLQHCPDVRRAFLGLVPHLRPGGEIVVDVYKMHTGIPPLKYWARPFVSRMKTETIHKLLSWTIPPAFEVKKMIHAIPKIGPILGELIPIGPISHAPRLNYTDDELKQVKILSALDMLSPKYDQPQRIETVRHWFDEAGLVDIDIWIGFNGINARGRRPAHGSRSASSLRVPAP